MAANPFTRPQLLSSVLNVLRNSGVDYSQHGNRFRHRVETDLGLNRNDLRDTYPEHDNIITLAQQIERDRDKRQEFYENSDNAVQEIQNDSGFYGALEGANHSYNVLQKATKGQFEKPFNRLFNANGAATSEGGLLNCIGPANNLSSNLKELGKEKIDSESKIRILNQLLTQVEACINNANDPLFNDEYAINFLKGHFRNIRRAVTRMRGELQREVESYRTSKRARFIGFFNNSDSDLKTLFDNINNSVQVLTFCRTTDILGGSSLNQFQNTMECLNKTMNDHFGNILTKLTANPDAGFIYKDVQDATEAINECLDSFDRSQVGNEFLKSHFDAIFSNCKHLQASVEDLGSWNFPGFMTHSVMGAVDLARKNAITSIILTTFVFVKGWIADVLDQLPQWSTYLSQNGIFPDLILYDSEAPKRVAYYGNSKRRSGFSRRKATDLLAYQDVECIQPEDVPGESINQVIAWFWSLHGKYVCIAGAQSACDNIGEVVTNLSMGTTSESCRTVMVKSIANSSTFISNVIRGIPQPTALLPSTCGTMAAAGGGMVVLTGTLWFLLKYRNGPTITMNKTSAALMTAGTVGIAGLTALATNPNVQNFATQVLRFIGILRVNMNTVP